MSLTIKEQWIAALKSGKYPQGRSCLQDKGKYCCLGVLCEVLKLDSRLDSYNTTIYSYKNWDMYTCFSKELEETLGIPYKELDKLVYLNDHPGSSFDFMADYISKHISLGITEWK